VYIYIYIILRLNSEYYNINNGHVAALTQKLPKVHVLLELEILIYQPLEAHEQVTD
jgi:hypothetical protein